MRLTVGRETAKNLAVGRKINNNKKYPLLSRKNMVTVKRKLWVCVDLMILRVFVEGLNGV